MKGRPESILAQCGQYLAPERDRTRPHAGRRADDSSRRSPAAAGEAMRTLAFAHAVLPADFPRDEDAMHDRRE